MNPKSPFTRRNRVDAQSIAVAVVLLALLGAWWLYLSRQASTERARVLAEVPDFPKPDQHPTREPPKVVAASAPKPPVPVRPIPAAHVDAINRFAVNAGRGATVGVFQFNALMNAPLVQKLDKCFGRLTWADGGQGFDMTRDVDRVAFSDDGTMMSGFFEGDPRASGLVCQSPTTEPWTYRGYTIYECGKVAYATQSSAILTGAPDRIKELVDQSLETPAPDAAPDEIYGDMYLRFDPTQEQPSNSGDTVDLVVNNLMSRLSSVTTRANVWDSVALSVDATPLPGQSATDLATSARGAIAAVAGQIADDDVKLSAFAELANVDVQNNKLRINLALPVDELVEKLNDICEREEKAAEARHAAAVQAADGGDAAGDEEEDPDE